MIFSARMFAGLMRTELISFCLSARGISVHPRMMSCAPCWVSDCAALRRSFLGWVFFPLFIPCVP